MPDPVRYGTVLGIDRTTGTCRVEIDEVEQEASYDPRRMPWPLCTARVRGGPPWRVLGPVGHRREIVHDDFNRVASVSASGLAACDTPWAFTKDDAFAGASSGTSSLAQGTNLATGVATITAAASASFGIDTILSKDNAAVSAPSSPAAVWFSARASVASIAANRLYDIGLRASVGAAGITDRLEFEFSLDAGITKWQFVSQSPAGGLVSVVQGVEPAANTFMFFDSIWANGFASGWINGDGPYTHSASVVSTASLTPHLYVAVPVFNGGSTTLDVDYVHMESVTPCVNPEMF